MALLAACSTNDEIQTPQQEVSSIDFATYAPTMTREADNSSSDTKNGLSDHHTTFKVWGDKTVGSTSTEVFKGQLVSYGTAWTYDPLRYWDKTADYNFYAVAPATSGDSQTEVGWIFNDATNSFSLTGFTLEGKSLSVSSELEPGASFSSVDDVDLMLAHDVTSYKQYGTPVALEFDHILSRFNIGVKAKATTAGHTITVNEVKVYNLKMKGDFNENATTSDLKQGTTARWTNTENPSTEGLGYTHKTGDPSFTSEHYVYRALVIPQEVEYENISLSGPTNQTNAKPYLMVSYTMDYGNNTTESFTSYYNLADAFGKTTGQSLPFNEGWMNTLHITLGPETIEFSGQVNQFAAQSSVNIPPTNGN